MSINIQKKNIEEHLATNETERKQSGEVFTPLSVVEEMLSNFPSEIWRNETQ